MKPYLPIQRLYSIPDQDKENYNPYMQQIRHGRVLSQLGVREKSSNSLHSMNQKPLFKAQKSLNGDQDMQDASSQMGSRREMLRVKTDCNVSIPMRNGRNLSIQSTTGIVTNQQFHSKKKQYENPQLVMPYRTEILDYMKNLQEKQKYKMNALQFQPEVTEKMRGILLDWIVDVHHKFKLDTETLFITFSLIDRQQYNNIRVLERMHVPKTKFQLFGITALFIAAKYEEVYSVPHIRDLVYVCDNAYTKEEIIQTEGIIINLLQFEILTISPWRMLSIYQETAKLDSKNYMLARYLIELALLEYNLIANNSNIIAAAAIYLVHKIRKIHPSWSQEIMVPLTGLQETDIRNCAKEMCNLLQATERKQFNSIRKKYSLPKYQEVARIRIEKKN